MVRLELLEAGDCEQPEFFVNGRWTVGKLRFPALVARISHPRVGKILFDCGYGRALVEASGWAARVYRGILPFRLGNASIGAVDAVFLSHFHPDHIGGLRDVGLLGTDARPFTGRGASVPEVKGVVRSSNSAASGAVPIWYSRVGLERLRRMSGFGRARHAFLEELLPRDFEARGRAIEDCVQVRLGAEWAPFESAYDLAGDGSLLAVALPGHALGQYGLICRVDGEDVFLIADAGWVLENVTRLAMPARPGRLAIADYGAYQETLRRLHALKAQRPDLWMIPSHCEKSIAAFRDREMPVVGPREYERRFAEFNVLGVGLEEARVVGQRGEFSFGLSTGTTGEPGVFITNERERRDWAKAFVAKTIGWRNVLGMRAALLLRHDNALYAKQRLRLRYFSLERAIEEWVRELEEYAPNVLAGPPSALEKLGGMLRLRPRFLLVGGEAMAPGDREALEELFGVKPRVVYQAKEGFLAVGNERGGLDWNEDLVALQRMYFRGDASRFVPVITDLRRTTQRYVRYRMDDVLRVVDGEIVEVEGRLQDVLYVEGRMVFPSEVHRVVGHGRYELEQLAEGEFVLRGDVAVGTVEELLRARVQREELVARPLWEKRRRVRRSFDPESEWIVRRWLQLPCR